MCNHAEAEKADLLDAIALIESEYLNLSHEQMKSASVVFFDELLAKTKAGRLAEARDTIHNLKRAIANEKIMARKRRGTLS